MPPCHVISVQPISVLLTNLEKYLGELLQEHPYQPMAAVTKYAHFLTLRATMYFDGLVNLVQTSDTSQKCKNQISFLLSIFGSGIFRKVSDFRSIVAYFYLAQVDVWRP